jgi:peptidoglycan L-alanyl-D-glutamate endopeptidase CwlK
MYRFSRKSKAKLAKLHPILKEILEEAIKIIDFTVLETDRNKEIQNKLFASGASKVQWPNSKHNLDPNRNPEYALAADIAPYPIDWKDLRRFYYLQGIVRGIAQMKRIRIRWGGDWDQDGEVNDQTFNDTPHVELIEF